MKPVPLFETAVDTFLEKKAEAIIKHYFPDLEPTFSYGTLHELGEYSLDNDTAGDKSKVAMMYVFVGDEKKKEVITKLEKDYEGYAKFIDNLGKEKGYDAEITYSDSDDGSIIFSFTQPSFKR